MVNDIDRLQTDGLLDCLYGKVHLILERLSLDIRANGHVGMSNPSIQSSPIQRPRLFRSLVPGSIVGKSIVLLGAISRSIHEDNAVISLVSEARPRPPLLVKHRLIRFP